MKKSLLFLILFLSCLGVRAQADDDTLISLHKENWAGVEEIPIWSNFAEGTDATLEMVDEGLAITNPHVQAQIWQPTLTVIGNCLTLEEGHDYIVRLTVKVPSDGAYQVRFGNWDYTDVCQIHVKASNDFQIVDVEYPEYKGNAAGDAHVLLGCGWIEGTTILREIEVLEKPTGSSIKAVKSVKAEDAVYNLTGQKVSNSYKGIVIQNGKKVVMK